MTNIEGELNLVVTQDENTTNKTEYSFAINEDKAKYQHLTDYSVPDLASDQHLDLEAVIGKVEELWLISDQEITFKLNADTETARKMKKFIISGGDVTDLYFGNTSGNPALVQIFAGG